MTGNAIFLYGTLRHLPLLDRVAGASVPVQAAELADHVIAHAVSGAGHQQEFPLFAPRAGAVARGLLIRPNAAARDRLHAYERIFGYDPVSITVSTANGPEPALIYVPRPGLWTAGDEWSLERWVAGPGHLSVDVATEVMELLKVARPEAIFARFGMLQNRAASRRRALAHPTPATLRRTVGDGDIVLKELRRPYTWYFGVEEADMQFRRFDGSHSDTVTRAGFIMCDAVVVLPYDPVRDVVMLVEQFRFGPYARGDANAWSLEPIAGRIDPNETPEQTAHRETWEEAKLKMSALLPVHRYFPSPGAVTEYVISYVGIADLPDSAQGVSGLEIEAEDIRAHVISYQRLRDLMDSGEIENAPLLITAQWLALNRDRLRADAGCA